MGEAVSFLELDYKPHFGKKTDYGIGFVGTGGIVQYAHIPAYRAAGLNIVACCDANPDTARKVAHEHAIPHVYDSLDALLADPSVEIVDIAVPPSQQLGIVAKAAAAGKHMLCQKPLSDNFADALKIVELGKGAGVQQAVNQQMRWDAGIRASKQLIDDGFIGQPTDAQIQVSVASVG
jgi:predicted dehydrogenase